MRQFLAADLPAELRDGLVGLQRRLGPALPGWRWLKADSVHLTLRFLGDVAPELDRRSREVWRRATSVAAPFRIRLGRVGRFPARGGPRVLWVGVEETEPGRAMARLAESLERAAREMGWVPERRPFRPHVTLARRGRSGRPAEPVDRTLDHATEGWIRQVVLYESRLEPSGARYTALESFPLGPHDDRS